MIVIGFDPGIATTGYGIINTKNSNRKIKVIEYGVIETSKETDFSERLNIIFENTNGLLEKYKPDYAGIEKIIFAKNTKTAIDVSQASGVITLAIYRHSIPIVKFTPPEVKASVAGYGQASKDQVQRVLTKITNVPEKIKQDDAADAVAIAICASQNIRLKDKMSE